MSAAQERADDARPADASTFAPDVVARELIGFDIRREVGKGSMGIVYEALRRSDGQRVALKVLPPSLTLTKRSLARFVREAELIAKVHHPAFVTVFEHGRQGRLHYFAMEFIDGVTLEARVEAGPLPLREAAAIAVQIARALHFAHERGIVHRDLKPGNVLLRADGRIAISDFGLARESGTGSMTESGALIGTPLYMAPEQVRGERADTRTDVYGLGATLYHLLGGRPPFAGSTANVLRAVLDGAPPPLRRARRDVPAALEAITSKAMEKDPSRRYGSALELAEELDRFLAGQRVKARKPGPARRLWRAAMARPLLTGMTAIIIVLAAGAFGLLRDRHLRRLESTLHQAEGRLAHASSLDESALPRPAAERQDLWREAEALSSSVLADDPDYVQAWVVRARARSALNEHANALADLDEAAQRLDHTPRELLEQRIKTLSELQDAGSQRRLRSDLMHMMNADSGPHTRCLVAGHLLELAAANEADQRADLLSTIGRVLADVSDESPRALVLRARLVELQGNAMFAADLMRHACARFPGSPQVQQLAAQMFARLQLPIESEAATRLARMLDPSLIDPAAEARVRGSRELDVADVEGFLGKIDELLQAAAKKKP